MKTIILALCIQIAFAYHDPDLNYHLSQIQKVANCDNGYSYAPPAVQLTTNGIQSAPVLVPQTILQAPAYQHHTQTGITYAAQPVATYQTSAVATNFAAQQYSSKEVHGYATSAGLSTASSNGKTVTPLATYAQAPIIAKVTAAPLIAKFSISQPKITYASQNLIQQNAYSTGSAAKASLNSYSNVHSGGPVVSQVYAAPAAGYATSPSLKVQQPPQYIPPVQYSRVSAPTVAEYHQVSHAPAVSQYSSSASKQYLPPAIVTHHTANIAQYPAPVLTHPVPAVQHYAPPVAAYSAPTVVQHSVPTHQYSAPTHQYAAPALTQFVPAVTSVNHYSAPVSVSHIAAPVHHAAPVTKLAPVHLPTKNVHKEFVENYDAHPRYAYEYGVNDPHTGDIKQQKEERDGEVVKGQYSLVEPDGSVRTVNYVADWETGFHADVRNSKDNQH